MKRSEIKVGDELAYVTQSFGSRHIRKVVAVDVRCWEKRRYYYDAGRTVTIDGVEYSAPDARLADRHDGFVRNGVLVSRGKSAFVVQLSQLEPWTEAKAAHDADEAAIQARWDAERAAREAAEALLERLGIDGTVRGDGRHVTIGVADLQALADRLDRLAERAGPEHSNECLLVEGHDGSCYVYYTADPFVDSDSGGFVS